MARNSSRAGWCSSTSDGDFRIDYYDKVLPIDPQTIPLIFEPLRRLHVPWRARNRRANSWVCWPDLPSCRSTIPSNRSALLARQREAPFICQRMKDMVERKPEIKHLVEEALRRVNGRPSDGRSFDALHKLLEAQAYRLAHWRVSAEEINYRRFFDINDLVGLRMEAPQVFAATAALIRRLLAAGTVSGLRIDHPDGLFNPQQYFARLQMLYAASQCYGGEPRQPQGRERNRAGITERLQPARRGPRTRAAVRAGGKDSGAGRGSAERLAGRWHSRLRLCEPGERDLHRYPQPQVVHQSLPAFSGPVDGRGERSSTRARN